MQASVALSSTSAPVMAGPQGARKPSIISMMALEPKKFAGFLRRAWWAAPAAAYSRSKSAIHRWVVISNPRSLSPSRMVTAWRSLTSPAPLPPLMVLDAPAP